MKTQRIYLDTSVIGGCFDPEFAPWSNGLLADCQTGLFMPVLSDVIAEEINLAPERVRLKYAELLAGGAAVFEVTDAALNLLDAYLQHQILGERYRNDLLHIAIATVADVDLVTSWNFKHIVRFDRIRAFHAVNLENGYKAVEIYSPREVTSYGRDSRD